MEVQFVEALLGVVREKGIAEQEVVSSLEDALALAYRRKYGHPVDIKVEIDRQKKEAWVFLLKDVVAEVENPHSQVALEEAQKTDASAAIGDTFMEEIDPQRLGRIAAQTAKQVLLQRVRVIERDSVYGEYHQKVGQVVSGEIQRRDDRGNIFVSLGKTEAWLPRREQVETERYRFADRMRFLVLEATQDTRTAQVILSRSHPDLVRRLMELEIPEIGEGIVEIVGLARRPGLRSKVAVRSRDPRVDPVGACVGSRGARASAVVNELRGEKVEVTRWSESSEEFIVNSLSPARVQSITLDEETHSARIVVPNDQLSLAIGKGGHNVRLTAKLTGWNIELLSSSQAAAGEEAHTFEAASEERTAEEEATGEAETSASG